MTKKKLRKEINMNELEIEIESETYSLVKSLERLYEAQKKKLVRQEHDDNWAIFLNNLIDNGYLTIESCKTVKKFNNFIFKLR